MSGVRKWKQEDCHSVPGQDELQNEHITKNNKEGRKERRRENEDGRKVRETEKGSEPLLK